MQPQKVKKQTLREESQEEKSQNKLQESVKTQISQKQILKQEYQEKKEQSQEKNIQGFFGPKVVQSNQTLKEECKEKIQDKSQKIQESLELTDIKRQMSKDSQIYYPQQHAKSKIKLKINTNKARGSLSLLKKIIKDHDWKQVYKQGDLLWSGSNDEDAQIGDQIMINKLPAISTICQKNVFAFILNKFKEYWPQMFTFYPKTYLIPENEQKLNKKLSKGNTYIAKPAVGGLGEGIILITKLTDLPQFGTNQWIVQPYINNPLLLNKKKFDLRLYVLISSVSPYICYLNEEGLARLCAQDYKKPNKQNMKNSFIHLTNYSINKNHPNYINGQDAFSRGGKRCMRTVWQDLKQQGIDIKSIKQKILQLTQRFLIGIYPFVKYYYNATFPKKKGKNFQILGIDIMIDQELNPWLLQANSNPSYSIEHDGHEVKKQPSPVDEYVKRLVVQDAIFIVKKSIQKQKQMQVQDTYYSYKKILDQQSQDIKGMNIIENMLKVFHSQCSIRSKWVLTSSQFIKLSKLPGMTSEKITKNDYHLIFIKIMRNKSNPNNMEFYDFIQAMEYIVKQIVGFTKQNKLSVMQDHLDLLVNQL